MTKDQLIAMGVDEKLAASIADASKKELEGYVEKSAHELLVTQNTTLQEQAKEHAKQLEDLEKLAGDSDAMKKQIAELQAANKQAKEEYEERISTIRVNHEIDKALSNAKAKNAKAVKALLDLDAMEWDEDKGKLTGLSKQLQKLQESEDSKFLFDITDPEGGKPDSGIHGDDGGNNGGQPSGNSGGGVSIGEQMAAMFNAEHAAPAESE